MIILHSKTPDHQQFQHHPYQIPIDHTYTAISKSFKDQVELERRFLNQDSDFMWNL
jgi:hypothetical protein